VREQSHGGSSYHVDVATMQKSCDLGAMDVQLGVGMTLTFT
jgi:hypothetical protein